MGNSSRWHTPARIFPLTGLLFCGYCGSPMRGTSTMERRYYRDASSIDKTLDCSQHTLRADVLEDQAAIILKEILKSWEEKNALSDLENAQQDMEQRFERARELYLEGDISREQFQAEKEQYEHANERLHLSNANVIITLAKTMKPSLDNWDSTLPMERKKLLRTAIRAAFVRGNTFVALQTTEVFWPLTETISCQCGEGGIRTRGRGL